MNKIPLLLVFMFAACNNEPQSGSVISSKEETLKKDLVTYPDSLLVLENLIQYYRESGNYDQALVTVNQAVVKDSLNPRLWDIKATLHYEDSDTLLSIGAFEKAVNIDPAPPIIISLGALYAQVKNPRALLMADALLTANNAKAHKEAFFIKGLYYASIKDYKVALLFFDKAIAVNYTFMDAYREKALILYNQGKYNDALGVLDKAVTLQNNFEDGYYYRGRCLEKLNRIPEAIENYEMALMYDPGYTEARDALGKLGIKK